MNADFQKIRKAKFFKKLPERVFDRVMEQSKVRGFSGGETALSLTDNNEFVDYIGYVVLGNILLLGAKDELLGLIVENEFFLGRPFSLNDVAVKDLFSVSDETLVVFIPKQIFNTVAVTSEAMGTMVENIYQTISERSRLILNSPKVPTGIREWIQSREGHDTLASWLRDIEVRRVQEADERSEAENKRHRLKYAVGFGLFIVILAALILYKKLCCIETLRVGAALPTRALTLPISNGR